MPNNYGFAYVAALWVIAIVLFLAWLTGWNVNF